MRARTRDELAAYNGAQVKTYERVMGDLRHRMASAAGWEYWIAQGCAEEFDRLWRGGLRDPEALYQSILAAPARKAVSGVLDCSETRQKI